MLNQIEGSYHHRDVNVVAINIDSSVALPEWEQYWRGVGGGSVIYAQDTGSRALRAFGVRYSGTTIVIDRNGRVVWRAGSAVDYETLKAAVEGAL